MIIVGANSLFGSLKALKPKAKARLTIDTTAIIPGLHIDEKTPNPRKSAFFYFNSEKYKDEKFVIWHDAVNNSLSPHRNNYYQPFKNGRQVVKHLKPHLSRIQAIVYRQRQGTPNIYSDLVRAARQRIVFEILLYAHCFLNHPGKLALYLSELMKRNTMVTRS